MPELQLPTNPVAAVIVTAMFVIFAWGGWKGLIALRRDWGHGRRMEDVALTEAVRRAATSEVARVEERLVRVEARLDVVLADLAAEKHESARLRRRADDAENRVAGLTSYIGLLHSWIAEQMPGGDVPPMPRWLRTP